MRGEAAHRSAALAGFWGRMLPQVTFPHEVHSWLQKPEQIDSVYWRGDAGCRQGGSDGTGMIGGIIGAYSDEGREGGGAEHAHEVRHRYVAGACGSRVSVSPCPPAGGFLPVPISFSMVVRAAEIMGKRMGPTVAASQQVSFEYQQHCVMSGFCAENQDTARP